MTIEKKVLFKLEADTAKLRRELFEVRQAAEQTATTFTTFGDKLRLSFDLKGSIAKLTGGLKEMAKGEAFGLMKKGIDAANESLEKFGLTLGTTGASIGFQLAGPLGAAAGAVGEIVGTKLGDWLGEADRAAAAAANSWIAWHKSMVAWEDAVEQGTKKTRNLIAAQRDADPAIGGVNRVINAQTDAFVKARGAVTSYAIALLQLQVGKARQIGAGISPRTNLDDVTTARGLRDAQVEQLRTTRLQGDALADILKSDNERRDKVHDVKALLDQGVITQQQYNKALGITIQQTELWGAARAKALRKNIGTQSVDFDFGDAEAPRAGWWFDGAGIKRSSHGIGTSADTTPRNEFGRDVGVFSPEWSAAIAKNNNERLTQNWNDRLAADRKHESGLASAFGPLQDFKAYTMAFDALSGAASSAMDAWIDGSMSAGKAFKLFIGDTLKGLASQMLVEGLKYEAYALGSLIPGPFFNPGAAAGYAATGAAFLAGSAAAAIAARSLGTSAQAQAGSSGGASSSSVPRTSSAGGASGGGSERIIVYEDSFAEANAHERARRAERIVARSSGVRQTVRAA